MEVINLVVKKPSKIKEVNKSIIIIIKVINIIIKDIPVNNFINNLIIMNILDLDIINRFLVF